MIAEIAAANAAFSVIKAAINNGRELSALGSKLVDYFDNKAKIQEKATKKGGGSDLAEFMALEQLRLQEEQLKEHMIYAGRAGMWTDWLQFQAQAARRRREAKEAAKRAALIRKAKLIATAMWGLVIMLSSVLITMIAWLINEIGRK
jgi:hypothetical protein